MARKDLVRNKLPVEYEEEVLELLESVGTIANPPHYAREVLGVSPKALQGFLQTNRAREAAARATPLTRQAFKKTYRAHSSSAPSLGLVASEEDLHNLQIIEEDVPGELAAAYRLLTNKRRDND